MLHTLILVSATPPAPPPDFNINGYVQLTSMGINGPCRGTSPTDNDLSAYGGNKIFSTSMTCQNCADICTRNVNASGYPGYNCVAFECTSDEHSSDGDTAGAHCELWSKPANFAGVSVDSPAHCFTKTAPSASVDAAVLQVCRD